MGACEASVVRGVVETSIRQAGRQDVELSGRQASCQAGKL